MESEKAQALRKFVDANVGGIKWDIEQQYGNQFHVSFRKHHADYLVCTAGDRVIEICKAIQTEINQNKFGSFSHKLRQEIVMTLIDPNAFYDDMQEHRRDVTFIIDDEMLERYDTESYPYIFDSVQWFIDYHGFEELIEVVANDPFKYIQLGDLVQLLLGKYDHAYYLSCDGNEYEMDGYYIYNILL